MLVTDIRGWTDLDPNSRFRNAAPNVIISADAIANGEYDSLLGDIFTGGMERNVIYDDGTSKFHLTLTLYVHPVGAGALDIDPSNTVGLANHNGKLLAEDGDYAYDGHGNHLIAGALLSHYTATSSFIGSSTAQQPVWATSLAEGDAIWLVRRGEYELKTGTGSIAQYNRIVADESTTGGVTGCVRTAGTAVATMVQIRETITGYGGDCVGIALVNDGAEGALVRCKLDLPPRIRR